MNTMKGQQNTTLRLFYIVKQCCEVSLVSRGSHSF